MRFPTPLAVLVFLAGLPAGAQPVNVRPTTETQAVVRGGNAATDVALWPHLGDPAQSLLIVADSAVGLITYRLDGTEFQALLSDGVAWAVDVREGFTLPGGSVPLVVVANGTLQALTAYMVDPVTRELRRVDTGTLRVAGFDPRTVTLYRSATTGSFHAFMAGPTGNMQQLELSSTDGGVEGVPVRDFIVGGAVAGAVADDAQGFLFVAEQSAGIWRYSAEPDGGTRRDTVAAAGGLLAPPLGGLALYRLPNGEGYLLAASEGGSQIVLYERRPPHELVGSFRVVADGGMGEVDAPRSVEASSLALGPSFPGGLVAVHDAINAPIQNYKLVSWTEIASAFSPPLRVNVPGPADGGTADAGTDGGTDGIGTLPGTGTTFPTEEEENGCGGCTAASVPGTLLLGVAGVVLRSRRRRQG